MSIVDENGVPVRRKRSRRGCWLTLMFLIILGGAGFYFLRPLFISGFGFADTREVGNPTAFDPVADIGEVLAYVQDGALNNELVYLESISASYVKSDGTLDLTTTNYRPSVSYEFERRVPPPADAPPIGAGGSVDNTYFESVSIRVYQPGQWRNVSTISGNSSTQYTYMNQGMERSIGSVSSRQPESIDLPRCTFADLWATAIEQGAPDSAVARIQYDADGYSFSISDLSIRLSFNNACQLER